MYVSNTSTRTRKQEMAMWCLWNVAGHRANLTRLAASNAICACLDAMKMHQASAGVQEQACWLLVCVCAEDVHAKQRARLLGAQVPIPSTYLNPKPSTYRKPNPERTSI